MAASNAVSQFTRPSLNERSRHYQMCIGWRLREDGKRVRASFSFGRDETTAITSAVLKQREWQAVADSWHARRLALQDALPTFDLSKPVWDDSPPLKALRDKLVHDLTASDGLIARMNARVLTANEEDDRLSLALIKRRNPQLLTPNSPIPAASDVTLRDAKRLFLAAKLAQVGLAGGKGINNRTYNSINKMICTAIGQSSSTRPHAKAKHRPPLRLDQPLSLITKADLTAFVQFWMGLPGGLSLRTAANYCTQVKAMLDWCADEDGISFTWPRGAQKLFRFRGVNRFHIAEYDPNVLITLLTGASDRARLYILLALNCGYYQQDIADLVHSDLVQHQGEWCLWRKRSKARHQNVSETLHWLFPETNMLIRSEAASPANKHGLLLLNQVGLPLIREEIGRYYADSITDTYSKRRKQVGAPISFKQFRKLGWNAVKRLSGGSIDMARKYAGQNVPGVARHYNRDEFGDLTNVLQLWREELRRDGVLPPAADLSSQAG